MLGVKVDQATRPDPMGLDCSSIVRHLCGTSDDIVRVADRGKSPLTVQSDREDNNEGIADREKAKYDVNRAQKLDSIFWVASVQNTWTPATIRGVMSNP